MWRVAPKRISDDEGQVALDRWRDSQEYTATAVRYTLQVLKALTPGNSVEVRIPPYGAAQVVDGPRHTRGTPPAVVETDPATWLALVTGELFYADAIASGALRVSGERSDLSAWLPIPSLRLPHGHE